MSPENRPFDNEGENHETTTSIPHSGGENVPEEVRERPVVEFKTPLDKALEQGLVNTDPEQPFEGFEAAAPQAGEKAGFDQKSSEIRNSYVETPKKSKKGLIIGGVASLAVAGAAVFGVNALANKDVTPTEPTNPDATAPVVPGETQAPTDTPTTPEVTPSPTDIPTTFEPTPSATEAPSTPAETEQGSEYTASELREMPVDEYLALNVDNLNPYIESTLAETKDWSFLFGDAETDSNIKSDLYKFNPQDIASEDNSATEIAMQDLYGMQTALTETGDRAMSGTFDPDFATKTLAGFHINPKYPNDGARTTPNNGSTEFEYWKDVFKTLDTTTMHQYAQGVESAEIKRTSQIRDDNGDMHTVVRLEYTTDPLPEDLGADFKKGTKVKATKDLVWDESTKRWLTYGGGTSN